MRDFIEAGSRGEGSSGVSRTYLHFTGELVAPWMTRLCFICAPTTLCFSWFYTYDALKMVV